MKYFVKAKNMREGMVILWGGREFYIDKVVKDKYNHEAVNGEYNREVVHEVVVIDADGNKWELELEPDAKHELILNVDF